MATIPSGAMRHLISIEKDSGTSRNAVGEITKSWSEFTTAYAEIKQLSGQELLVARQINPSVTVSISCHYQPGIEANQRIKWHPTHTSTKTFYIESVENVDYKNHTIIMSARED